MKKIVALVAVLFSVVVPVQSQAAVGEKIVIVDSYFDVSSISGSVEFVCVASDRCVNKTGSNRDHGTQMALIARQQNPSATLVLVQSAPVSKKGVSSDVNLIGLISALDFVNANPTGVSAVSFSRYVNNSTPKFIGQCFPPAVAPYTPQTGFDKVKSSVLSLNSKGIQVYAAAGNNNKKSVDFPACISEVVSVGSTGQSYFHQNAAVLDLVGTIVQDNKLNYISLNGFTVEFSTSFATAALAAKYGKSVPTSKSVEVRP